MREQDTATFEAFLRVLPRINEMSCNDVGVSVTDREKYLLYKSGKHLDLQVKAGDQVKEGSTVYLAMKERRRIVSKVDKALFGQPCIAVAIPLFNDSGEVIGAASMQETVDRQETLKNIATRLMDDMGVLASTSEEILAQAQDIAAMSRAVAKVTLESMESAGETNQVLDLTKNVAQQTNLLGLNAAIEAARVGDQGRGFGVVAEEIRKLANDSTASIKKIEAVIQKIQHDADYTSKQMEHLDQAVEQVSEAIAHVANAIQETNNMAQQLDALAEELVRDSD